MTVIQRIRPPSTRSIAFALLVGLVGGSDLATAAQPLSSHERELLTTRTALPQPSEAMIRALELDVAPWHKPGVKAKPWRISKEAAQQSTLAALQALDALPDNVPQNDFDRAWLAFEKASALQALGRADEARSAFQTFRQMPRSKLQDRYALVALNSLGDAQAPGWCERGKWAASDGPSHPTYPPAAARHGIEGWLDVIADVQPDGAITYVTITSSSLRTFEPPAMEWTVKQRFLTSDGHQPGRPCFARFRIVFKQYSAAQIRFSIDEIGGDTSFSYRSVGAAIRVRVAAREKDFAGSVSARP